MGNAGRGATRHWVVGAVAIVLAGVGGAEALGASAPDPSAVIVQRVGRECFIRAIHATGYIVPRDAAVVMFNAPDFRISEVLAKPGDTIGKGDIVARATSTAGRPGTAATVDIRSMAAGLVLGRTAFVGMPTSAQAEPLFTLAHDGEAEAAVDLPGTHVFEIQAGQVAHVSMRDGTVLDGHVRLAPPIIDSATQTGQARIAFEAARRPVLGRFVRATIEADRSCGIGVPQAAVRESSSGPQVQVVERGLVVTQNVTLGLRRDAEVEVTAGLRDGALIVADTGASLHDGDRVAPIGADGQDVP